MPVADSGAPPDAADAGPVYSCAASEAFCESPIVWVCNHSGHDAAVKVDCRIYGDGGAFCAATCPPGSSAIAPNPIPCCLY